MGLINDQIDQPQFYFNTIKVLKVKVEVKVLKTSIINVPAGGGGYMETVPWFCNLWLLYQLQGSRTSLFGQQKLPKLHLRTVYFAHSLVCLGNSTEYFDIHSDQSFLTQRSLFWRFRKTSLLNFFPVFLTGVALPKKKLECIHCKKLFKWQRCNRNEAN